MRELEHAQSSISADSLIRSIDWYHVESKSESDTSTRWIAIFPFPQNKERVSPPKTPPALLLTEFVEIFGIPFLEEYK